MMRAGDRKQGINKIINAGLTHYTHLSTQLKDFKSSKFTQIINKIISNSEKVGTKVRHGCL